MIPTERNVPTEARVSISMSTMWWASPAPAMTMDFEMKPLVRGNPEIEMPPITVATIARGIRL